MKTKIYPQPIDTSITPRFASFATFMRLPIIEDLSQVDIALLGLPWDGGTTNRPGARHGPRQIREMSSFIRKMHHVSKIPPFLIARVGDCGDVPVNPMDSMDTMIKIENYYKDLSLANVKPLTAGGDHLMTLPILRGIAKSGILKNEPLGLIQFDAHSDTLDIFFGSKYTHGTGFRRAIEENLLDPKRMVQIGIRGAIYDEDDYKFARDAGVRIITIEKFYDLGIEKVIAITREIIGDKPAYLSFDVDGLDPVYAPGTGTPEIGGMTSFEAQRVLRGFEGLHFIGGDVVEVSPPFDPTGNTALVAATLMFEILCLIAKSHEMRKT
ncbi:MAG: agmatinase [Alphaproteobacteria bacterium]|nr:agmatinase [Alphaproteobacteria bacterium]